MPQRPSAAAAPTAPAVLQLSILEGGAGLDEIFLGPEFQAVRRAMLDPGGAPGCSECPIKANRLPTQLLGSGARPAPAGQSLNT